jgi:hypothetical protein
MFIRIFLFRIPDPRGKKIPDPGSGSASKNLSFRIRIKEFKYFITKKNCFKAPGNMIQVVHPGSGSRIRILIFLPIPDPGVKKAPDPGSRSATLMIGLQNDLSTALANRKKGRIVRIRLVQVPANRKNGREERLWFAQVAVAVAANGKKVKRGVRS